MNTFSGTFMHCTAKHTETMLYIASHPSNPTLPDWLYNYPKSSAEEYASLHISSSVKALSMGSSGYESSSKEPLVQRGEDPTVQLVAGMSDFSIKLMASKVKAPKDSE